MNFTDLVNVLKNRPNFRLDFSNSILTTDQESAASRRLSVNLLKVSNQLAQQQKMMETMQNFIRRNSKEVLTEQ